MVITISVAVLVFLLTEYYNRRIQALLEDQLKERRRNHEGDIRRRDV